MTNLEKELIKYVEATEDAIKFYKATDLSKEIWQRHKLKRLRNHLAIAASTCLISVMFWMQHNVVSSKTNTLATQQLLTENALLEQQLQQVYKIALPEQQTVIMATWYHQLAVIDQAIELQNSEGFDEKSWSNRKELLVKIIYFYTQPIDVYEI
jgi:dipeptide/tripeptide permease